MEPHGNIKAHMVSKPSIETVKAQSMHYASLAPATTIRMGNISMQAVGVTDENLVINDTEK